MRRLYLDDAPGERRGVVTLNGLPEWLLIERQDEMPMQQPQACGVVRVRRIERALKSAFLDLGGGADAVLPLNETSKSITEGAWVEVEIVTPARGHKGAVARLIGMAQGPARLIVAPPSLEARLTAFAPGLAIAIGAAAREAADIAEEAALQVGHPLPSGGRIFIEPTQALTAIDVDLGAACGDSRKAAVRANLDAILAAARLLRLKGLGGLVAIDLAGKGHDGKALSTLAKTAFEPDGAGVSIGPISRFGVLELAVPRTVAPISERLLDAKGELTVETVALRLLRSIERAAGPGQMAHALCAPDVAAIAQRFTVALTERIGPRFSIATDPSMDRTAAEVRAR